MSARALEVSLIAGVLLSLVTMIVGAFYFSRKSAKERQQIGKKMQDRTDKVLEGDYDPNDLARFVP